MGDYQSRKTSKPETGQLQRRSKYYPATDESREIASLTGLPRVRQRATSPRMTTTTRRLTNSLPPEQEEMPGTDPLLPRIRASRNQPSFPGRNENPEEENTPSLLDYLTFLGQGIQELLQSVPPGPRLACLFLCLSALIVLFSISNALLQILGPIANAIYICTGIIASMIAIHDYLNKRR